MQETDIQWCDSTVNPTGFQCAGCELWLPKRKDGKRCYAGRWAERVGGLGAFNEPVELKPGRMAAAAKWPDLRGQARPEKSWIPKELPRLVFIGDMTDLFCESVPFEYLRTEVVETVSKWPHIGILLTKRPTRLVHFSRYLKKRGVEWPDNLWIGASVTSRKTLSRVGTLLSAAEPWTTKIVSLEPLWESVVGTQVKDMTVTKGLERYLAPISYYDDGEGHSDAEQDHSEISWVITGGESGPHPKPCYVEWIQEIVELCANASLDVDGDPVHCFVKQLGAYCLTHNANTMDWPLSTLLDGEGEGAAAARAIMSNKKGASWAEWPDQIQVRQFPSL